MFVSQGRRHATLISVGLGMALAAGALVPLPAMAAEGSDVIINEAYLKGGSAGAPYTNKFIELYNTGDTAQSLDGWSLQYRSATGAGGPSVNAALSGTIQPNDYFLISWLGNGSNGAALPVTADLAFDNTFGASGTTGTLWLADTTTAMTLSAGSVVGVDGVVDLIGYGSSNTFEGAVVPVEGANGVPNSLARTDFVDTDNNAADFVNATTVTPQASAASGGEPAPEPTETVTPEPEPTETTDPAVVPIAEIQGTGDTTPLAGQTVTTRGVVTAAYPAGGYNGFYIQTPGTGGALDLAAHTASEAVFVWGGTGAAGAAVAAQVQIGDHVEVTGVAGEFNTLTQVDVRTGAVTVLSEEAAAVAPSEVTWPETDEARETLEGMLLAPQGDYTVSDTYDTNYYASIGLASGTSPLVTATEVARPGTAEYDAAVADNAARAVTLDDGASVNFNSAANKSIPLPYLSTTDPVRVGAAVTFTAPVVLDYRNGLWTFQPTQQLTVDNAADVQPATFENTRTASPADVGGDIQIASFNVLNYFTTTGVDAVEAGASCSYYNDREGNPITVNTCTSPSVRGAANDESLARQQAKIVAAINALDAEVVSLEEIENSSIAGKNRDAAVADLVDALNAVLGSEEWAYVPSPSAVPAGEDVIRTAFIYKKDAVEPVGDSVIDDDPAFVNARYPLAQAFAPAGGDDTFLAIVNHFKSKSSGSGVDADQGDGQGASNASRVAQATALVDFADELKADLDTELVFLLGDFNAYTQEDPMQVFYEAGYVDQGSKTGKHTYSYDGASGSLDHILASASADELVTGVDIWNINAAESIALEYSRYNYNATNFYDESPYRSSDHDPLVVGIDLADADDTVQLNLLNINDFHGRIDANTVKFAGTIEQLRAEYGDESTLFLSAGDNIGASLFPSSSQGDIPTLDVLNALDLAVSTVGNHEFDQGFADLIDRVAPASDFPYLGANVYDAETGEPVLDEYATFVVDGLTVAVIGTVTEETPTVVSPLGIEGLEFGDPVDAVNRVAAQLSDGDPTNGEADVIIAEYHEGAPASASLEAAVASSEVFAKIVNETDASVDAIFTGHTHATYVWSGPIPGGEGTRPVLQTGSYGERIGQIVLDLDPVTGDLLDFAARNVARTTVADDLLVEEYPRVAEVKSIVDAAIAEAAVIGDQPIGSVTADITTAFSGGSYVDGVYTGGARDNRAAQSAMGNLVAEALLESLSDEVRGGAEIGVVNPGGLRAELFYAPDGVVTYAEANGVLPFLNNLWTTTLTGAQFTEALEQQWRADGQSYLQLGLSSNVSYTFDASAPLGERITGVWIDGEPIDPEGEYRIGSFNFLLGGGDAFTAFAEGTDTRDSGLIDRDAWIAYITANSPLAPDFSARAVQVTGVPESIEAGQTLSIEVSGLDLTSLGSPANSTLEATIADTVFAPFTVVDGAVTVELTVPAEAVGDSVLVLTATDSGTEVRVPLTVTAPEPVELNLLNINDFHGRIDGDTVRFAGTIEQLRAEYGDESTLFLSAGDNIGASLFASAVADDQPTLDVLNALDLGASAVGNHEFDKGLEDLLGRVSESSEFPYLGANVYAKGTTDPVLPEYATFEVDGLTIAVIGVVTEETPSLVSPGGIADIEFGDPVEAVNRVTALLTDGDETNGEADVIIAEYHEGAVDSASTTHDLADELALGGAFAAIVTDTSAAVDVIFTGHTHKEYVWDAPVPGTVGKTRPVVQTGNYGELIGQVVLEVDPLTSEVTSYTAENVARLTIEDDGDTSNDAAQNAALDAELVAAYPRVAEVKTIVDAALAEAAVIGDQPVGSVTADITSSYSGGSYVDGVYTGGTRDNRAGQSTLGNLVADSLVSSLGDADRGGAQIGLVNPGGLRAELFYGDDGVITYAEANSVLPFVNNLWTTTLTGAQFKAALEQQWQPDDSSRPYLQLGLSSNVSYTFDESAPRGERVTGIWIDGQPLDPAGQYRVGSFNFLLTGGDNFTALAEGTDTRDSGLVDRDAWIAYLQENPGLSPSFASRSAQVTGVPVSAEVGESITFDVAGLDMTSLGSPATTTLTVGIEGSAATFEPVTVSGGAGTVTLTVPADAPSSSTIVLSAAETGTEVLVPLAVTVPGTTPPGLPGTGGEQPSTTPPAASDDALTTALQNVIQIVSGDPVAGGTILVYVGEKYAGQWVSAWLHSDPRFLGWYQVSTAGTITVTLPSDLTGSHRLVILDADGNVIGWQQITIGPLAATGGEYGGMAGLTLVAMLLLGAGVLVRVVSRRRNA